MSETLPYNSDYSWLPAWRRAMSESGNTDARDALAQVDAIQTRIAKAMLERNQAKAGTLAGDYDPAKMAANLDQQIADMVGAQRKIVADSRRFIPSL